MSMPSTTRTSSSSVLLALLLLGPAAACLGREIADAGPVASVDGGALDAGGPVDAGSPDAGQNLDAGTTTDAGGEGEGEGDPPPEHPCEVCVKLSECVAWPERLGDIIDDAGMPRYDRCFNAYQFANGCTLGECATNDTQRAAVAAMHQIAAERGYRIELRNVTGGEGSVSVDGVLVIDWAKASFWRHLSILDGGVDLDQMRLEMPVNLPRSLPPLSEIIDELRTCDTDVFPDICRLAGVDATLYGTPVGECGWAAVHLWSEYEPDAGCCQATCTPSDLPCCYSEDY